MKHRLLTFPINHGISHGVKLMAVLRNQPRRLNIRLQKIQCLSHSRMLISLFLHSRVAASRMARACTTVMAGFLRIESIIDPFLCLLTESVFSLGFCCESINRSSHNESPKLPGFGVFNCSSCTPVKSGGTPLYSKSDSVAAIAVDFVQFLPQRPDRSPPLHLHLANRHQVHFTRVVQHYRVR